MIVAPIAAADPFVSTWVGNQPGGGKSFDGLMDELAILDRALTGPEIVELMQGPLRSGACGDGFVDPGEACDDLNDDDDDECRNDCTLPPSGRDSPIDGVDVDRN